MMRYFHSSTIFKTVDKVLLSKLRKKTGFAISQCKKALELHEADIDKAEKWLIDEAQAHGWSKATKLSNRATSQGLIGIYVKNNVAGLLEVNCETDFVAKNEDFRALVASLTKDFANSAHKNFAGVSEPIKEIIDKESINCLKSSNGELFKDKVAMAIGKIGENIQLSRGIHFIVPHDSTIIKYVHPPPNTDSPGYFGKYATVVAFNNIKDEEIAREISAHIIGMNPNEVGTFNPDEIVRIEAENQSIENSLNEEEETEDIKPTIPKNNKRERTLVYQDFLSDPEMTVGEVLQENDMQVIDFVRLECGENLQLQQ